MTRDDEKRWRGVVCDAQSVDLFDVVVLASRLEESRESLDG